MHYSTEELFGNVKPGSKKEYALKQKYKNCVEGGWIEKEAFQHEDDIVCLECYQEKLEAMD